MRFTLPTQLVRYLLLVLTLGGCRAAFADAPPKKTQPAKKAEPHFEGMGKHTRHISTKSTEAQRFFDQGLIFLYGFNHDEAIRSFEAAAANDPKCAMAYWGIAMANGPHINSPSVDKPHAKAAWEAIKQARDHQDRATPVEKALIEALAARYADPQPEDRHPLDKAFADAMRRGTNGRPKASRNRELRKCWESSTRSSPSRPRIRSRCICTFTPTRRRCIPNGRTPPPPASAISTPQSGTSSTCRRTSTFAAAAGKRRW
jgi:hypothetical protein